MILILFFSCEAVVSQKEKYLTSKKHGYIKGDGEEWRFAMTMGFKVFKPTAAEKRVEDYLEMYPEAEEA